MGGSIFRVFSAAALIFAALGAAAAVVPAPIFNDEMVLQRDTAFPVWGKAAPGETVTVEFAGAKQRATAGADGRWSVTLGPLPASSENRTMTISGANDRIEIKNVLVGEVWLCSGQSNMEMPLWTGNPRWRNIDGDKLSAAANYPEIRIVHQPRVWSRLPLEQGNLKWRRLGPDNAPAFSAVAFFFGTALHRELKVPVGLVGAYWGGTLIEPWTPPAGFDSVPELSGIAFQVNSKLPGTPEYRKAAGKVDADYSKWLTDFKAAAAAGRELPAPPAFPAELVPGNGPQTPAVLYNAMIHPFVPYAFRGAIWYQGCSNLGDGPLYGFKMAALVDGWRKVFGNPRMPFFFFQLAPYNYGANREYRLPVLWETQQKFADSRDDSVGMAVINDVGDVGDIHPHNKKPVGDRLARLALKRVYGKKNVKADSPAPESSRIDGNAFIIKLKNAESLQTTNGAPAANFEIAGADGVFHQALAAIDGVTLRVSSDKVASPVALRYMWGQVRCGNLFNEAGLPLGAFRILPESGADAMAKELEKNHRLVFDYDLVKGAYAIDNSKKIDRPFKRVTYLVSAEPRDGSLEQWIAVSMDAFTADASLLGVPAAGRKPFQCSVARLSVRGNAPGVTVGDFPEGNIEFWPNNYGPAGNGKVPGASDELYDFGDTMANPVNGYGSMQVHNTALKQTVYAYNHFVSKANADFGFGNSANGNSRDWTFSNGLNRFNAARIRVYVGD